jgi:hypothetical protein
VKDFVARKANTIALSKVQGTNWNVIKCKERLGNCPEAVIGQATINLYLGVWKSLEDSLSELYWVDLAEAYVTQESASLRVFVTKKGMICNCSMDICFRNLWQKTKVGKKTSTESTNRFPQASCFEKIMHFVQKHGGACTTYYLGVPRYEKTGQDRFPCSQERRKETKRLRKNTRIRK